MLRRYKDDIPLAFDADLWIARSDAKTKLEGGGFGRPKPPLFPGSMADATANARSGMR